MTLMIRRVSVDGDLISISNPSVRFQKLTGAAHTYRIRVGDYRVVYEVLVESKIVEIARVRHRKDVYR